jgi:predicted nucleotidyltransferase
MKTLDQVKIQELSQKHDLKLLLLFGSQISGKTHAGSDYDFAFLSERDFDFGDRARLRDDLASLVHFESEVEEVDLKEAHPFLLKEILANHKVLHSSGSAYEEFYSYAFRTCLDSKRLFDVQEALYQKTVTKYRQNVYGQ